MKKMKWVLAATILFELLFGVSFVHANDNVTVELIKKCALTKSGSILLEIAHIVPVAATIPNVMAYHFNPDTWREASVIPGKASDIAFLTVDSILGIVDSMGSSTSGGPTHVAQLSELTDDTNNKALLAKDPTCQQAIKAYEASKVNPVSVSNSSAVTQKSVSPGVVVTEAMSNSNQVNLSAHKAD